MMTDDLSGARETVLMLMNWMQLSVIFIDWGILHSCKSGAIVVTILVGAVYYAS